MTMLRKLALFAISLLPVLLGLCLFLAFAASLAVPVAQYLVRGDFTWLPGAIIYLLVSGGLAWWVSRQPQEADKRTVGWLICGSTAVKLALIYLIPDLPLNIDQAIFRSFVEPMADEQLSDGVMTALSANNDYSIWAGRVLPVHYLLRYLAGDGYLPWLRVSNVVASTAILFLIYLLSRHLLPAGKRKWAVYLMVILPLHTYMVTDYSHHLYSSLYLLSGTWCAVELIFGRGGWVGKICLSATAGICLLLMMLQRGIHLIALGAWVGLLVWTTLEGRDGRRVILGWVMLLVIPLAIALPAARSVDHWLAKHDQHQRSSMLPAFVARGWCPETAGEFCGRYEQIDWATPMNERAAVMWRLVASQIRHNPEEVCFLFPPLKTAKLFLVGYASNLEESLAAINAPALSWARGARLAGAPLFLCMATLGCFMLGAHFSERNIRWLPALLVSTLTWVVYVFLGETSPRYSVFSQAFLALLGAHVFSGAAEHGRRARGEQWRSHRTLLWKTALVGAMLAITLVFLAMAARLLPAHYFFVDLEKGWGTSGSFSPDEISQPGDYHPFEVRLHVPSGAGKVVAFYSLPVRFNASTEVTLYLLGRDETLDGSDLLIKTEAGMLLQRSVLSGEVRPQRICLELPPRSEKLVFEIIRNGPDVQPGSVQIGYLAVSPAGKR